MQIFDPVGNPVAIWMGGHTNEVDATGTNLYEKEDVERLQEQRFHGKKIAGKQLAFVMLHQMAPA